MSICLLVQISQPSLSLWSSLNFSVPYFSLSLSLNVIVAVMIVTRLLLERRKIVSALGRQHAQQYVSIAAMIIESAALYSIFSLTFLGLYGANHPVQNIFLQILPQIEVSYPSPVFLFGLLTFNISYPFSSSSPLYSSSTASPKDAHGHQTPPQPSSQKPPIYVSHLQVWAQARALKLVLIRLRILRRRILMVLRRVIWIRIVIR